VRCRCLTCADQGALDVAQNGRCALRKRLVEPNDVPAAHSSGGAASAVLLHEGAQDVARDLSPELNTHRLVGLRLIKQGTVQWRGIHAQLLGDSDAHVAGREECKQAAARNGAGQLNERPQQCANHPIDRTAGDVLGIQNQSRAADDENGPQHCNCETQPKSQSARMISAHWQREQQCNDMITLQRTLMGLCTDSFLQFRTDRHDLHSPIE